MGKKDAKSKKKAKDDPRAAAPAPVDRGRWLAAAGVLFVAVFVAFGASAGHEFVQFDDHEYIVDNPNVKGGLTGASLAWVFTSVHHLNWHPLTSITMMIDVSMFGLDAGKHHIVSVLIHVGTAFLLLLALVRLTGAFWTSALVVGLFALHPLRAESVVWAAERKDVLSGLFWAATLVAYAGYARTPDARRYAWVAVGLACGLMSKSMVVTLPFVLLLMDVWPLGRWSFASSDSVPSGLSPVSKGKLVLEKLPFFGLVVITGVVTVLAQGGSVQKLGGLPLTERIWNAAISYVMYLVDTVWPTGLAVFYPHPLALDPSATQLVPGLLAMGFLIAVTAVVLLASRRRPYLGVGWLWYLGTMAPVIGVIQVGSQARADRYTYIPMIGIYLMVAFGLREWVMASKARRQQPAVIASLAVVAALMVLSILQTRHWQNSETLFRHALRVTENNYLASFNLGTEFAAADRIDEAGELFAETVRMKPDHEKAHLSLGTFHAGRNELDEAAARFEEAIRLREDYAEAHFNLGNVRARQGRLDDAQTAFETTMRLDPGLREASMSHRQVLRMQAEKLARAGDFEGAVEIQQRALDSAPAEERQRLRIALEAYRQKRLPFREGASGSAGGGQR